MDYRVDDTFSVRMSSGHKRILQSLAARSKMGLSTFCATILRQHIWNLPGLTSWRKPKEVEYD